jgi:putative tricarboxylic transport membrane protein
MNQLLQFTDALFLMLTDPGMIMTVVISTLTGIVLAAVPGLTSTVGLALVIPFSFYMSPLQAIAAMYCIHKGGSYGGSIPAILMNTPGCEAAACTQVDGYPLTLQGKQGKALKTAVVASAMGDFLSDIILIFGTVYIAQYVWRFGPIEMTSVIFFSLMVIGTVTGESAVKGLIAALAGLLLATIGLDPISGTPRLAFGVIELENGLDVVPVLIGLFIFSEILIKVDERIGQGKKSLMTLAPKSLDPADNKLSLKELKGLLPTIFGSFMVGQVIGMLPGLGAAVAPWISYGQAKNFSKHSEKFGKGALEGVAAAEASNNAVCGANMMPLLTLGVPGSTDVALMMGVFLIHGLELGPRIFANDAPLVYGIFASGILGIIIYFTVGFFMAEKIGRAITHFPSTIVYPVIFIISVMGAYSLSTSLFDVYIMVIFGFIGFLIRKLKFPIPPLIIALILGPKFEINLRKALLISDHNFAVFISHRISLVFILLAALVLFVTVYKHFTMKRGSSTGN